VLCARGHAEMGDHICEILQKLGTIMSRLESGLSEIT
jgi:hypothetical protein